MASGKEIDSKCSPSEVEASQAEQLHLASPTAHSTIPAADTAGITPIITRPVNLVSSLDGQVEVPVPFTGWEIVLQRPTSNPPESGVGPSHVETNLLDWAGTRAEPVPGIVASDLGDDLTKTPNESSVGKVVLEGGVAGTGTEPVLETVVSDKREEHPSKTLEEVFASCDMFEKVGDIDLVEPMQNPRQPSQPAPEPQTQTGDVVRRKRIKTTAGRLDLAQVRRRLASPTTVLGKTIRPKQSHPKPSSPLTRKFFRIASQSTTKTTSSKQSPIVIEDLDSSAESTLASESQTPTPEQATPVIPTTKPNLKGKAVARKNTPTPPVPTPLPSPKEGPSAKSPKKPKSKKAKTTSSPPPNVEKFLNRGVVKGKVVREKYFRTTLRGILGEAARSGVADLVYQHPDGVFPTRFG